MSNYANAEMVNMPLLHGFANYNSNAVYVSEIVIVSQTK